MYLLEVKAQLNKFFEAEGFALNYTLLHSLHNQDLSVSQVGHVTPYKIRKECYLFRSCFVDARRMLLFMDEQGFLLIEEVWLMHNTDT